MIRFHPSLLALLPVVAFAQTTFEIADVHVSPRSTWVQKPANAMQVLPLNAGRYEIRRATMVDLIRTAYSVDADKITGGPNWLEYDRFNVIAKAPANTRANQIPAMLQSLLADRFGLTVATTTKPMPAYVLSPGKDRSKLKPAEPNGDGKCSQTFRTGTGLPVHIFTCGNVTMDAFAADLRRIFGGRLANLAVADQTGIDGTWDVDLEVAPNIIRLNAGAPAEPPTPPSVGVVEAIDKQMGLKLALGIAPQPVLEVRAVRQQPSANPTGVAEALPPLPAPVFEVASVKLSGNAGSSIALRYEAAGRVTAQGMPIMSLISDAFGLASLQKPIGTPKWLADGNSTAHNITIVAKAPPGLQDRDSLLQMLRALLIERYQIKFHYEDQQVDALSLTGNKPKLTKADPSARTGCTRQPEANTLAMKLVCRNMTLTQFAEQMQSYDSVIPYPVLDETGVEGAWDFTLNYNFMANLAGLLPRAPTAGATSNVPSDPDALPSFKEAVEQQLGLKLVTRKRTIPVLAIDHIEEMPIEN